MPGKEMLQRIRKQELDLKRLEEDIAIIEARCERITGGLSDMKVQSSRSHDGIADTIVKMVEVKGKFAKEWDRLIDMRIDAEECLKIMSDRDNAAILYWYYIRAVKWERVAVEVSLDLRWVHRRRARALAEFEQIYAIKSHLKVV